MVRIASLAVVLALGCSGRGHDEAPPKPPLATEPQRPDQVIGGNIVPQSHEVPAGRATEIRALFESGVMSYPIAVVSAQGAQTQFVSPKPVFIGDNRFVVGAPPQMHVAIDDLIKKMGKASAPVSSTYELTFWIVEAVDAPKTEIPRDLAEVGPMLDKLAGLGKRRFKSLDRVAARSRDGAHTKLSGRMMKVEHKLTSGPDGLELDLELALTGTWSEKPDTGPTVETKLHIPLDQAIVIGDSAQAATSDGAANLLLYVVRAKRVD